VGKNEQHPPSATALPTRLQPLVGSVRADEPAAWEGWPAAIEKKNDRIYRPLPPGRELLVRLSAPPDCGLIVVTINPRTPQLVRTAVKISIDGVPRAVLRNPDFPQFLMVRTSLKDGGIRSVGLSWERTGPAENLRDLPACYALLIEEILALPSKGMFSRYWCTPWRRFLSRLRGGALAWSPLDFPYSHFDGLTYLRKYPEALASVLDGECKTGAHHFKVRGRLEGRKVILAREKPPNPGSIRAVLKIYRQAADCQCKERELAEFQL
jgi:hypothetical protein